MKLEEGPFVAYCGIVVGVGSRSTLLPPWELKEIPPSPREAPPDGGEVGVANVLLGGMLAVGVNGGGVLNVNGAVGVVTVLGGAGENPGVPEARVGKLVGLPPWHSEMVMVTVETR